MSEVNNGPGAAGTPNPDDGGTAAAEPAFSFTDNRKIDPVTGEVRPGEGASTAAMTDDEVNSRLQGLEFTSPDGTAFTNATAPSATPGTAATPPGGAVPGGGVAPAAPGVAPTVAHAGGADALAAAQAEAAKNLDALQRSQADYVNLRNRTTRQIATARADGREDVFRALLPVLDQLYRAQTHGELTGPMEAISTQIDTALGKLGFTRYGAPGDEFDPAHHEAVMHQTDPEAASETVKDVFDAGYLNGEKVVRPAKVSVVGPS